MIMKTFKIITFFLLTALLLSSCFEDTEVAFTDTQIEFEDAVMRARATGQLFPIINLTRASGSPGYQINLIGEQLTANEDISFSVDEVPATLLNGTTIAAQEGVHYALTGNTISFPVAESKATLQAFTIDPAFPAQAGMSAILIIRLDGNERISPAENFRRLGFRISLN
jgi:hypothetical protein